MPHDTSDAGLFCGASLEMELRLARLALASTSDGVLVHRPDGTVVLFNDAMARSLGFTPEEFTALPPFGWTRATREERLQRSAELREHGELTFDTCVDTVDGRRVHQEVHARMVDGPDGELIVSVSRDITQRVCAEQALHDLAYHDSLTGLANRAAFDQRFSEMLESARRHGDTLGVIMLDLDDFKDVNDNFGHAMGDMVLAACAHRLESTVRQEDVVARLGGDEFVIVAPRLERSSDIASLVEKLKRSIGMPLVVGDVTFCLSTAAGTAVFDAASDDACSVLARADDAMYAAKALARGVL